jgi:transposase
LHIYYLKNMSLPIIFVIKESLSEIKKLQKKSSSMITQRLRVLYMFKEYEHTGIAKRTVAEVIGVNQNSVQVWRSLYISGGIELLTKHGKVGFKPSVFTAEQALAIKTQVNNPKNGFVGFVEFKKWFDDTFNTTINYKTFHGFVVRKFQAKIKVARKVHVKKDEEKVIAFKKTLVPSAKKSTRKKVKSLPQ